MTSLCYVTWRQTLRLYAMMSIWYHDVMNVTLWHHNIYCDTPWWMLHAQIPVTICTTRWCHDSFRSCPCVETACYQKEKSLLRQTSLARSISISAACYHYSKRSWSVQWASVKCSPLAPAIFDRTWKNKHARSICYIIANSRLMKLHVWYSNFSQVPLHQQ